MKLGCPAGWTFTENDAVFVLPPPVPVSVSDRLPTAAEVEALTVNTVLAPENGLGGLNANVKPLVAPETVSATALENPPCLVIVTE